MTASQRLSTASASVGPELPTAGFIGSSDELLEKKPYTSLSKKLFIAGLFLPFFPWIHAVLTVLVFRRPRSVAHTDPEKHSVAAEESEDTDHKRREDRYWAWVCLLTLCGELLLAGVIVGIVVFDKHKELHLVGERPLVSPRRARPLVVR